MPIYVILAYSLFISVPVGLGISIAARQKQVRQKIKALREE